MNKPPPNTTSLNSLKSQGYKVIINHCRRVWGYDYIEAKWGVRLVPDSEWRVACFNNGFYKLPEEKGGATILTLIRGEEKIIVRADCYIKDSFCRRQGVLATLNKLEKLYGIK